MLSRLSPGKAIAATSVLLAVTIVWIAIMGLFTPLAVRTDESFICGRKAILNIELARHAGDLKNSLAWDTKSQGNAIRDVRLNTKMDLLFIVLYWLTILSAASIVLQLDSRLVSRLVLFGCILVTIAAVGDYIEDYYIFQMLASVDTGVITNAMATAIHRPSIVKWITLGAGCLLLGVALLVGGRIFLDRRRLAVSAWIYGALTLLAGGFCLSNVWCFWCDWPGARF